MPAPQAPSYYGPGSSVGDPNDSHQYQPQNVGWKDSHQHPGIPASPPPSYAGHGYEYGSGGIPAAQGAVQQAPQQPLQVCSHHGPESYSQNPQNVYGQQGQGGGYYAPSPSPSPAPMKHKRDKKDHGHSHGSGSGKYPRPGGDAPPQQQVVYVERQKKSKDGFAWGCCAGCTAAFCCCGCVVM